MLTGSCGRAATIGRFEGDREGDWSLAMSVTRRRDASENDVQ